MIDIDSAETPAILAAIRQDKDAVFEQAVKYFHGGLVSVAASLVGSAEAEEVAQESWISAYNAIDSFEGRSRLRTWLTRIVVNHARMRLRKRGREVKLEPDGDEGDPFNERFNANGGWRQPPVKWNATTPEDLLEEENLLDCLDKKLTSLPSNQRLVLEMRDIQGIDFEEICNILDLTSSNTRVLLHRARAQLFNMVDHFQETGEC